MTPDAHPIIGRVADGVYAACGFSGHGFMQSPAVGRAVAEEILDGGSSLDLERLPARPLRRRRGLPRDADPVREHSIPTSNLGGSPFRRACAGIGACLPRSTACPRLRRLSDLCGGLAPPCRARPRARSRRRPRTTPKTRLPRCRSWQPDLITMDVELPGMNGLEAVERIMNTPSVADPRPLVANPARGSSRCSRVCCGCAAGDRQGRPESVRARRCVCGGLSTAPPACWRRLP